MANVYVHIIQHNRKKLVALSCLLCFFCAGRAQKQNNTVVSKEEAGSPFAKDTALINKVLARAYTAREIASDSSKKLYTQALYASTDIDYKQGMAEALCGLGRYYDVKNQHDTAMAYLRRALPYCGNDTKGNDLTISIYHLLSESYYYTGRYDSCAWYRYAALSLADNSTNASPLMRLKAYSKILQFWVNVHEDIKKDPYIEQIMQRINALEKTAIAANDVNLLENIYFQKAGYYHSMGNNDSARYYGNRNIELGKVLHVIPSMIMASYVDIGITYLDDKKPGLAIYYLQKVAAEAPQQGRANNRYLFFTDIFLGEAYCMQKQYQKAIAVTEPALAKAEQSNIITITDHAHKTLAEAYGALGQYQKSAEHYKQYAVIRDSMLKSEKMDIVYNVEMKYRIADKDKAIAQKELAIAINENRIKSKNLWITGISTGCILIILLSLLLYRNTLHKQKLQVVKFRNLQQEMKINQLNAMISGEEKERSRIARELHDGMGGTLATIRLQLSALFRRYKDTDANGNFENVMQLLEEASSDLRKSAHNLMPEILLQEGLVKASEMFCDRIGYGHTLQVHFEAIGDLPPLNRDFSLAVYRIVQELVTNIVKHAEATRALVQFNYHNDTLNITIEDNGKGIAESSKSDGMGIKTLTERVKLLYGQMDIHTSPGNGTSIYIEFSNVAEKRVNPDA